MARNAGCARQWRRRRTERRSIRAASPPTGGGAPARIAALPGSGRPFAAPSQISPELTGQCRRMRRGNGTSARCPRAHLGLSGAPSCIPCSS